MDDEPRPLLADWVTATRRALKMTQAQLARRSGVPESTISRIEAGKDPRASTLGRVLAGLDPLAAANAPELVIRLIETGKR